jgi:hypothetical protein
MTVGARSAATRSSTSAESDRPSRSRCAQPVVRPAVLLLALAGAVGCGHTPGDRGRGSGSSLPPACDAVSVSFDVRERAGHLDEYVQVRVPAGGLDPRVLFAAFKATLDDQFSEVAPVADHYPEVSVAARSTTAWGTLCQNRSREPQEGGDVPWRRSLLGLGCGERGAVWRGDAGSYASLRHEGEGSEIGRIDGWRRPPGPAGRGGVDPGEFWGAALRDACRPRALVRASRR